ncbi:hypothetical protein EPJ66_07065 [Brachyspira aalborgi]|uniref:Lipoprotein n=1 Tax=Brachyspira aalborgi TaxID=29522 RepID=A0A5C8ENU9_9SPIR|nr:hypothetical protein [Brachyspira aalborgi]TXJ38462.1 hypothetical protein EPJ81_04790 [Brachyspira aalborgi]TXJ52164.1 hypothetical protein EPJ66_07065 [Brachyspira aalborgi]
MTQKNILKILVIMIAVLSLFAVSCRKASTSPEPTPTPTPSNPTDPIKNLTGNLLIVSTDGKTNLNSLPLSFVGASATVTEVTENPPKLNLDTTNFIVENNALKLTKFDLSKADAAVSNKVTLTFSLSGENLSRYTDTAEIFVGKYSNIYTNTFETFTNLTEIQGDDFTTSTTHKYITFKFNDETKTFFKDNTFNITNNNTTEGDNANELKVKEMESLLKGKLQNNTIFKTYFNDVKVSFVSTDKTIATFKVDLTPKSALFETPYTSYNFIFDALKGKWVQ